MLIKVMFLNGFFVSNQQSTTQRLFIRYHKRQRPMNHHIYLNCIIIKIDSLLRLLD